MWFGYLTWERGEYVCAAFSLMQQGQEEDNRWGSTLHCTTAKSILSGLYWRSQEKQTVKGSHSGSSYNPYLKVALASVQAGLTASNWHCSNTGKGQTFLSQETMGGLAEKYVNLGFCTFYFQRKAEGSGIILPEYSVLGWELLKSIQVMTSSGGQM